MDSAPEQGFDDIVKVAALICNVPMALISLVDSERQWFKAALGLAAPETPRDIAFCAHAIQQHGTFTVENAATDDRFRDNPLVTGDPNLRFYAGAPLETPDGLPLGTLCVLDTQPRSLTADQEFALQALARQVMAQLELRQALARRKIIALEQTHRIKNILTIAQAVVSQTLRQMPVSADARPVIAARLQALGQAQEVLSSGPVGATTLGALVSIAISGSGMDASRFESSGPEVIVGPKSAMAFGLALHELTTNAVKYGALSNETGRVTLTWGHEPGRAPQIFRFVWQETGGPAVVPPKRLGFGSRLIQSVIPPEIKAKTSLDYLPAGVRWTLESPAQSLAGI
jgi:two-component sensor histidine kinase